MSELGKITALLDDADLERRLAAAVVLGALAVKDKDATRKLEALLARSPEEQRVALDAFARIGPKKILPQLFELLSGGAPAVREAAARALKAAGADVVDDIRARREKAGEAEKRELDRVLADLGGADAFKALLDGLGAADEQTARAAALSVRERVSAADARTRKAYANAVQKHFAKASTPQAQTALLKILGWCEDDSAVPLLKSVLADGKRSAGVRGEAIIALRFALAAGAADKDVVEALLDVAGGDRADPGLARTALDTLAGLALDDGAAPKLVSLALHRDPARAQFAIEKLRAQGGKKAAAALVDVVVRAERATAEQAAAQLVAMPEAKASSGKLIDVVIERLVGDGRHYETCLGLARVLAPEATAAALRELAAKLKKQKRDERAEHVLILLTHTSGATDDDRVRLALAALHKSRLDARPDARARDEAIKLFTELHGTIDVLKALKKDKHVTDEQLFYLGFHFVEEGDPLGEQLLREVIARGPRTKLAKAAKNKLALEAE